MNVFTAIFCGFSVFGMLGFMAHNLNVDVSDVVQDGPALAFIGEKTILQIDIAVAVSILFTKSYKIHVNRFTNLLIAYSQTYLFRCHTRTYIIAYPEAVLLMPLPQLWAVLFFVMMFILGKRRNEFLPNESLFTQLHE